ncbi:MAG: methyltransferase domain-containing protein [Proteobacteria bacterium]|nr:methyltransferase domain-containing protein [Pseudomonadota bacterium]
MTGASVQPLAQLTGFCRSMSPRIRHHVNPLKAPALAPRHELRLAEGAEVEVELGCGDGFFLVRRALQHPTRHFVGLDIRADILERGRRVARRLGLSNLALEASNFLVDLPRLFPPERVLRFWINFPDPLFKRRQRNRRWLGPATTDALVIALRPGGLLLHQSDVWEPTLEALGLFETHPLLCNTAGEFSFARERLAEERTSRELACERRGLKIWRLGFERRATPGW